MKVIFKCVLLMTLLVIMPGLNLVMAKSDIGIILNDYSIKKGEELEVFAAADKGKITEELADVYLIVVLPDTEYYSFRSDNTISAANTLVPYVKNWSVSNVPAHKLLNIDVPEGIPEGSYQWILLLVKSGQSPAISNNIISKQSKILSVGNISSTVSSSSSSGGVTGSVSGGGSSSSSSGGTSGPFSGSVSSGSSSSDGGISVNTIEPGTLTAGDIDDHLNYSEFLNYVNRKIQDISKLINESSSQNLPSINLSERIKINIEDANGQSLQNAKLDVIDISSMNTLAQTYTNNSGVTYLFPHFDKLNISKIRDTNKGQATTQVNIEANLDKSAMVLPNTVQITPDDIASYHFAIEVNAFDSLGLPLLIKIYFARTDVNAPEMGSSWDIGIRMTDNNGVHHDFLSLPASYNLIYDGNEELQQIKELSNDNSDLTSITLSALLTTDSETTQTIEINLSKITQNQTIFEIVSIENDGMASNDDETTSQNHQLTVTTEDNGQSYSTNVDLTKFIDTTLDIQADTLTSNLPSQLDLMFIIDTTGSMSDELLYLMTEFRQIISDIYTKYPNLNIRFGLVVYRDTADDYVVKTYPFTDSVDTMENQLQVQHASGGGDYPEAMEQAFQSALNQSWRQQNTTRIAFLVADAPPHDENLKEMIDLSLDARQKGIRTYSLAASGVADTAEYLMRVVSSVTQARYLFLTDDSGVGNPHVEPDISCYIATKLNNLIYRVIDSEISGNRVEANDGDIIRKLGTQIDGVCQNDTELLDMPFITQ